MAPDFSLASYVYLTASIVIPIVLLGCLTPIYVVVDKVRSPNSKTTFYDRWLYNGSSETGICLLSLTLLIAVATSSKPTNFFLSAEPTYKMHSLELLCLSGSVIFITIMTGAVLFRYGLKKDGKGFWQDLITASLASATLLAPGLYYFFFRLPWKLAQ